MMDLSSSGGEGDENVAMENGDIAQKELNDAKSDVEKAKASKSSIINVYKRKNKENKMKQVQVEPEKKAEERSDLAKQSGGGKKGEKKVKDGSDFNKQQDGDKKVDKKKKAEVKDRSDFSKQQDGGKKEDKRKKAEVKANVSEEKAQKNEVSKVRVDSKEDHKRKDIKLEEDEDRKKKRKGDKLKEDSKGKRKNTELKEAHPEGIVQRESVSKKIRKDNAKDEKSKKGKVKIENESTNGQIQDRKKKQVVAEDDERKGQIHDVKKQKVVEVEVGLEDEKENGTSEISLYKFPMNRVSRIIKNEDFNGRVSTEAIFLINKASEQFLKLFAKEAYASAYLDHKTCISYAHLSSVVSRRKRFDFLADFVPEKVKAEGALAEMANDET